ncbi:MAG TPA: molybdopterin-dependent oxidoreductase, partial [Myxococcaceae bacterium]|nr:molybdopterin-dependent oxidoreductase [Myxococcaceae bacterium]
MRTRRQFLTDLAGGAAALGAGAWFPSVARAAGTAPLGPTTLPAGTLETSFLEALPGKRPLIKRTYRPPNFETPLELFEQIFTPNDAFFVRYHLARIPEVAAASWKLEIGGDAVEKPFTVDLAALQRDFEQVELAAVCQCSGNRRGLSDPHVPGVEWGVGAMGNARWKGVRLKDVLAKAGLKKEALEVAFNGADQGSLDATPDFVKSIPVWKATDENTLLAWQMNGAPLPHWNGAPVRLVVAGWTGTYWMKHLVSIQVLSQPLKNFWMATAYRIPKGKFPIVDRFLSQETEANTPITEMVVNSLITSPREGQILHTGQPVEVKGIAWDNGAGIRTVEVSADEGRSW